MKNIYINLSIILVVIALQGPTLAQQSTSLNDAAEEATIGISYNLELITSAANFYYFSTGSVAQSVTELVQNGWIPTNLINPMSGYQLGPMYGLEEPGDISILGVNNNYSEVQWLAPDGTPFTFGLSTYNLSQACTDRTGNDLYLYNYQERIQFSFTHYWRKVGDIPSSINDLKNAGFWPFDGTETNPYTGEPLEFSSNEVGGLRFVFEPDRILCIANYADGTRTAAAFDLGYGADLDFHLNPQ